MADNNCESCRFHAIYGGSSGVRCQCDNPAHKPADKAWTYPVLIEQHLASCSNASKSPTECTHYQGVSEDEAPWQPFMDLLDTSGSETQRDKLRTMLHLSNNSRDDYVVIQASYDSISHSCVLRDPVAGGGSDCHADHFTGNSRQQCKCPHARANWELTRPNESFPTESYVHIDPWDIPIENLIHGGKSVTSSRIPIVYCKDCQHDEITNPDAKLWEMVHVCRHPDLQVDGQEPFCIKARSEGPVINPVCPYFEEASDGN